MRFHVWKFEEIFTETIDFSRGVLDIFSRTGPYFHAGKSKYFYGRELFFHVEKKTLVLTIADNLARV